MGGHSPPPKKIKLLHPVCHHDESKVHGVNGTHKTCKASKLQGPTWELFGSDSETVSGKKHFCTFHKAREIDLEHDAEMK